MSHARFDDWSRLPGAHVEVWRDGVLLRTGTVDTSASDSTLAWITDSLGARFLVDKASGVHLRIPREQFIRRIDPPNSATRIGKAS